MYLARIEGTLVAAAKHEALEGCRFLIARRLEADGSASAEPIVVVDWMGAGLGSMVLVTTDGSVASDRLGKTAPVRLVVLGIVDQVHIPPLPKAHGAPDGGRA